MFVPLIGPYNPVTSITPVAPVTPRKKGVDKPSDKRAATRPARSATTMASHHTRSALDDMKLGG